MSKQLAGKGLWAKSKGKREINSVLYALCSMLIIVLCCGSFGYAQTDLKSRIPDLCYQCHIKLIESLTLRYVHFPFNQGKCDTCHNVHASSLKDLMKDDINSLCLSCHEGIKNLLNKGNLHGALKEGICTDCHFAHSGKHKHLLVEEGKKLCWDCHETLKGQLNKSYAHLPFKEGECSSCHNSHASSEEDLLLAAPNTVCKNCHPPGCNVGSVSISFATKELDCITCHTGHSSDTRGLLGPYGHTAFLDKSCRQCHNPIVAERNITTRLSGKDLCFSCHEKDSTKFREADIHGGDKSGCAMCHNYHASKRKNLTVKEAGLCFTCHQDTEKRQIFMVKTLKSIKCVPVKDRKCFECHVPLHSNNPLYLKEDKISTCARCHKAQHKIAHPLGNEVLDPRNGQSITCITCHSMHSAKAEFMLVLDRKRALCIQCHKR